ncbi:MAG: hypothetical protein JXR13_04185 [Thalassovita sp.]
MTARPNFLALFSLVVVSIFVATASFAQDGFHKAVKDAQLRNDLVGPFGYKHNWDQYIDKETIELQFEHDGKLYGWEDLFSRASFFLHTDLGHEVEKHNGEIGAVNTDDFTRFHVFQLDGVQYLAGWLNFHDEKASVFKITEVDTALVASVAKDAAVGKGYDLRSHHIKT